MERPDWKSALGEAFAQAVSYLDSLPDRPVHPAADLAQLRAALGGPLPERPHDARDVVADLAAAAGPGVIASGSGRFFGFVVGGTTPAALAADWLTSVVGPERGPVRRSRPPRPWSRRSRAPGWSTCSACHRTRRSAS